MTGQGHKCFFSRIDFKVNHSHCLPDNDGFLRSSDESKSQLWMPLEGDIPGLGHLLRLCGAPLPGVLIGRGLVDVTEIGYIVNICSNTDVCKYKLCDDISNNWPGGSLFTHYSLLESFDPVERADEVSI